MAGRILLNYFERNPMATQQTDLQKAIKELTLKYLQSLNFPVLIGDIDRRLTTVEVSRAFPLWREYGYTIEEAKEMLVEYVADFILKGKLDQVYPKKSKTKDGGIKSRAEIFELDDDKK